jgi:hypothetical protein
MHRHFHRRLLRALAALCLILVARAAAAQSNPKFEYGKAEEVKVVEWKAQAKGGGLMTSGNSQTLNGNLGASVSRKEGNNKLALDGGFAYGKSRIITATPDPVVANQVDINQQTVTTTNNWLARGRYDRFFTANNAAYALGQIGADKIAGKTLTGGGQIGYSRQLFKNEMHLVVAELGYDFSYERYVQPPDQTLDPVSIHSARAFLGETFKVSGVTGLSASVEALFNLNKESKALNINTKAPGVDPFKDTRVNAKAGMTTTLYKSLSVGAGFLLKYDQNPAPRPLPKLPAGTLPMPTIVFGPELGPFADRVDLQAEVTLIYTFL